MSADLSALIERGIAQLRAGQRDAAVQLFRRALRQAGGDVVALLRLGQCFESIGDFGSADEAYSTAIRHDPDQFPAYRRAADMAFRASALAQDAGQSAAAAELRHGAFQYLAALGVRLVGRGAWKEAADAFLEARAIEPGNWAVHVDLGHCLYQMRDLRAAEQALREGIRLAPGEARAHYHLGVTLLRDGRAGEAAAALRRAIALDPSLAPATAALAEASRVLGSVDGGIEDGTGPTA